ncbi:transcription initiation factor TFIID subunit 11 isoform X2 [Benincasa hispida]|uniref:transcription initiation factor TFIID subunit 11 isoform X2 n=1 Tax=Benincasa hispida TaxID=102211 RepID=UPI0019004995|nr:transcription initiation factor TFIID subunit 11 isoform X2 [Benincasa hispida]
MYLFLETKQSTNYICFSCSRKPNQRYFTRMKQSKDPFEAAFEEQEESPPNSPSAVDDLEIPTNVAPATADAFDLQDAGDDDSKSAAVATHSAAPASSTSMFVSSSSNVSAAPKTKEDDDEEEEENVEVELAKFPSSGDPDKNMAKMQAILSQFTEEQMSRYESFRRAGFQKANMKRLLASISGTQKISVPMTIVVSGIAKMFVGELVETARVVMTERNDSGPIRPCHLREAYRRLKLEGKIPRKSVPRLFR